MKNNSVKLFTLFLLDLASKDLNTLSLDTDGYLQNGHVGEECDGTCVVTYNTPGFYFIPLEMYYSDAAYSVHGSYAVKEMYSLASSQIETPDVIEEGVPYNSSVTIFHGSGLDVSITAADQSFTFKGLGNTVSY